MVETPGPAHSCLFVCRRGAGFPPSVSVCSCLPFVGGGRVSGSACTLPVRLYVCLFSVRLCEGVGSHAPLVCGDHSPDLSFWVWGLPAKCLLP